MVVEKVWNISMCFRSVLPFLARYDCSLSSNKAAQEHAALSSLARSADVKLRLCTDVVSVPDICSLWVHI